MRERELVAATSFEAATTSASNVTRTSFFLKRLLPVCEHMFVSREATILHADLDAFYASVEQRDEPGACAGRPVIVGARGRPRLRATRRSACGVRTATGGARRARRLCPQADRRPAPHVGLLGGEQGAVFAVFQAHHAARRGPLHPRGLPRRTRNERLAGTPEEIAIRLRGAVRERVDLPISVGVARTKFLAKVASGVAKPDGLIVVPPDRELAFLHPLP